MDRYGGRDLARIRRTSACLRMHGSIARSSSLYNPQFVSQPPKFSAATSPNVPPEALASQRLDNSNFASTSPRSGGKEFPVGHMPTRSRKRYSKDSSSRRVHADETIRELKEDIHELLSAPLGSKGHNLRSRDRWGSNIATPSHSRPYSLDCDPSRSKPESSRNNPDLKLHSRAEGYPPRPKAKGYIFPLEDPRFDPGYRRGSSIDRSLCRLNSVLGTGDPIQCDFRQNPTGLRRSDGRRAKLEEPALIRHNGKIRVRQMTLVFSRWDWEIVVSTPATLFPDNSSPANVETIKSMDILEWIYLHLSEPVLSDSEEWNSASSTERDIARQSLARREGKTLRRIDWLGGKTVFKGLKYVGGAMRSQGAGADGGQWMVTFG